MIKDKLLEIIHANAGTRQNGRVASERTFTARKESLQASFKQLAELGFKLQEPANLQEKHIKALMHYWIYKKQAKPKTIEASLSNLRIFATWIGKASMVKSKLTYVSKEDAHLLRVEAAARAPKSATGNRVDLPQVFARADAVNRRLGLILRIEVAFGLRREEALKCRPHAQDFTQFLRIDKGHGKGGRERHVNTLTSAQREILATVKAEIPKGEALGWPLTRDGKSAANLKQNITRYNNYMRQIGLTKKDLGITGHSLRAQFAENNALVHGIIPPSMGGAKGQMSKDRLRTILLRLSENMGHNRPNVMSAYYCSFGKRVSVDDATIALTIIDKALVLLAKVNLPEVPEHLKDDCHKVRGTLEECGLEITLRQTHYLWVQYSMRNGAAWVHPEHELAICMQSAAIAVAQSDAFNEIKGKTDKRPIQPGEISVSRQGNLTL